MIRNVAVTLMCFSCVVSCKDDVVQETTSPADTIVFDTGTDVADVIHAPDATVDTSPDTSADISIEDSTSTPDATIDATDGSTLEDAMDDTSDASAPSM
ncbi:MAG: hypothetical protein ACNA8W_19915, partial [Bradymonadaceae bacterium]